MRIAYLMNAPIPSKRANSVHVMKMCQAFKNNGVDIDLYCETQDGIEIDYENIYKKYAVTNRFPIYSTPVSKLSRKLKYSFFSSGLTMTRSIKQKNYDLIYGRSLIGIYLLRDHGKFIYESHISPINSLFKEMESRILNNKNCLGFVVISEALRKEYIRLFPLISEDKFIVLHDGADIPTMISQTSSAKLNDRFVNQQAVIGYLGHLYPGKCMEVLIQIALKRKQYVFHVVGGTEDWVKYWKNETHLLNLNNIIFYGFVENNMINEYYSKFDICVLPFSRDVYFSNKKNRNIGQWISPLKLFEAMSYKKAIIASKLVTIEEVLEDGNDSFLADPNDIDEWVNKLDILVKNEEIRMHMGEKAFQKFEKNYTWDKRAKTVINTYKDKLKIGDEIL